jgi:hypothetical protein
MINDVLDLAIPDRDAYAATCSNRDNSVSGKRKFRKFNAHDGEYAEGMKKKFHKAIIWRTDSFDFDGSNTTGNILIQCQCKEFSETGPGMEVFEKFEEHAKNPAKTEVPNDEEFYCEELDAHLVTSYVDTIDGVRYHAPAIDIDFPVHVRESSPGKSHLFIDTLLPEDVYMQLLSDMAKANGIVEHGYASASKNFHCSNIRMPDVKKGTDLKKVIEERKDKLKDPLAGLRDLVEEMADG